MEFTNRPKREQVNRTRGRSNKAKGELLKKGVKLLEEVTKAGKSHKRKEAKRQQDKGKRTKARTIRTEPNRTA